MRRVERARRRRASRQEFGLLQFGDRLLEGGLDGRNVVARVRRGHEAREVVEDVYAAASHHGEQQILQRMVFEPADAPERREVANLERRAGFAAEGREL